MSIKIYLLLKIFEPISLIPNQNNNLLKQHLNVQKTLKPPAYSLPPPGRARLLRRT